MLACNIVMCAYEVTLRLLFQFSEAYNQLFIKSGVPPKRKITNFMVTEDAAVPPGQCVDTVGYTIQPHDLWLIISISTVCL